MYEFSSIKYLAYLSNNFIAFNNILDKMRFLTTLNYNNDIRTLGLSHYYHSMSLKTQ